VIKTAPGGASGLSSPKITPEERLMKRLLVVAVAVFSPLFAVAERLPRTVLPVHYDLSFTPHLAEETFDGRESIAISVQQPTGEIVLNTLEIDFRSVTVESAGAGAAPPQQQKADVRLDPQRELATLTLPNPIEPGPAVIRIDYSGRLNRDLRGFYIGRGPTGKYAASQGESTDIRRAFPSFDEPEMKATYSITIVADKELMAISNSAVESDTAGPGANQHTVRFSTTPRLSSYLVALSVGDYHCLSGEADGVPLRICALGKRSELGGFALDASKSVIRYYNHYYGMRYPFGKLDHIAIPDFRAGAMENAGAIVYRETALLTDEKNSSLAARKSIASVIGHETAHMWFGDLVTMRWWNDVWLNEGFASWMQTKPLKQWHPEWRFDLDEISDSGRAMATDVLSTTRPIRANAESSGQIAGLFDAIAYQKTASVLRMIESYIGEETFRSGVNAYLASHAFGNAESFDFSDALAAASHTSADQVMNSFVSQPGVPVISVKSSCDGDSTVLLLHQERFFAAGKPQDRPSRTASAPSSWTVPICPAGVSGDQPCQLLRENDQTLRFPGCSTAPFLNSGGRGYFISEYPPEAYTSLLQHADSLATAERMVLARDEWQLVRSGRHPIGDYLQLAETFRNDATPQLMRELALNLAQIERTVTTPADRNAFHAWMQSALRPLGQQLATRTAGEQEDRRVAYGEVLAMLATTADDPDARGTVRRLAQQYLRDRHSVDPNLATSAIDAAAAGGDARFYDQILAAFRLPATPEEYRRFLTGLAMFRDPALLERTMQLALSDEVRTQDTSYLIAEVVRNPAGAQTGWNFVQQHWSDISRKVPDRLLPALLSAASSMCDPAGADQLKRFAAEHPTRSGERSLNQALERISICTNMRAAQQDNLQRWLERPRD
jgi:aminopeptidase N